MAEYIKRILAKAEFTGNFRDEYPTALIHALIDSVPAADVVEVVRCKDCKHRGEQADCPFCWLADMKMGDEHFCSYGERRADA